MTRKFDPNSTSYPVLAALETMNVTDREERIAAYEWAGEIANRLWGRPHTSRLDQHRENFKVIFGDRSRRVDMEIRWALTRAVEWAMAQPTK